METKPINRDRVIVRTSLIGIAGNLFLVAFKAVIGLLVSSVSIISDALNNLADALSSLITIIGTKLANKKPDKKHPYGYGRIEYVTSLIIAAIVLFAGASAIFESLESMVEVIREDLWFTPRDFAAYHYAAIIIVSGAILVKIFLGLYFRHVGKKVSSGALKASGADALTDSLLSAGTLLAAIIALTTSFNIECFLGIAIGCFIVKSGIEILISAVNEIIGGRAEKELTERLKAIVNSYEEVHGTYDVSLSSYGPSKTIGSAHIEVDDSMMAKDIQILTRKIVTQVYEELQVILTVGIYAANTSKNKASALKEEAKEIIKEYPCVLEMHGFYLNEEEKTVSFDLVIDFSEKDPGAVVDSIREKLKKKHPQYNYSLIIDADVSN